MHPASLPFGELLAQVQIESTRGSGPGGQHRNRVDTAIRMVHRPTGIKAQAGERRSKHENQQKAFRRLRLKLALQHREPLTEERLLPPGVYEPSELWHSRLQGRRMVVSRGHDDFPALLAEALDVIEHCGNEMARAARLLLTSTGQLVRFLGQEPVALAAINERRKQRGLKPYRASS